jgi:uncharacterized protein
MRTLRLPCLAVLAVLLGAPAPAAAVVIPEFTPNVVDVGGHLDDDARRQVNDALQRLRETTGIHGAVFVLDTLGGEPIENVAVEAFAKWQLGEKGVDDGLLLVLAMEDRQSRFEVGYGLEGSITDVAALHALDLYLAPRMRAGDTAGAIVDAFEYLGRLVAQDPGALRELDERSDGADGADIDWGRGLVAWMPLLFALWLGVPIRNAWVQRRRERLRRLDPSLSLDDEDVVRTGVAPRPWQGNRILQAFLSVNPGIFVIILSGLFDQAFYACLAAPLLILALVVHFSARRYASPARYRRFLDALARRRARMLAKGHLEEKSPGVFTYTAAYLDSLASSSSSSSDSSYSSSSGGGRSGGGGASSGW